MMTDNRGKGRKSVLIGQRIQMNIRTVVAVLAAVIVLTVAYASNASAETANTLKISPLRTDIDIKAGESRIVKITLTNVTNDPITVHPVENDFVSGDERGTPSLILDDNKYAPSHSLKRFMAPLKDVTIAAGQSKTVNVKITVPAGADAGGYFGAVRFTPVSPDDGGQVNLSANVASLILLRVPGEITEKLDLTDFAVQQNGTSGVYFGSPDNLEVLARFKNNGGAQVGPFGKISVTQGDKVVYQTDFNNKSPRDMVLPGTARRWNTPIEKISDFGYYTVHATFTYGEKNQTIEVAKSFWVIPMWFVVVVIASVVVLIALIVGTGLLIRRRRRHHRRAKHRRKGGLRH